MNKELCIKVGKWNNSILWCTVDKTSNWNLTSCFFRVLSYRSVLMMTLSHLRYWLLKAHFTTPEKQNLYVSTDETLFCLFYNSHCWNKLLHLFYGRDYLMAHKHVQNFPVFQTARQIIISKRTTRQYSWNRVTSSDTTYNKLLWSYCTKTTSIRRFFTGLVSRCLYFLSRIASFLNEANDYSVSFRNDFSHNSESRFLRIGTCGK